MFKTKKKIIALAVASLVVAVCAGSALADTANVTATVTGGSLSEATSATPSFSATLDGTDQTPNYTLPTTVTEARGTGAGWNLTITSTQFSTGGGKTLSTGASTISSVSSICATGTCTNPTNSVTYPAAVPAGSTPPTAVKFFNGAANTGMGKFTVTPSVDVSVPANTFAGSYSSTVTLAVVTGP